MSRCDVCLSDDNDGVSCEDCSVDYTPELEELARLRIEVVELRERVRALTREPGDGYCDCGERLDKEHSHGET